MNMRQWICPPPDRDIGAFSYKGLSIVHLIFIYTNPRASIYISFFTQFAEFIKGFQSKCGSPVGSKVLLELN